MKLTVTQVLEREKGLDDGSRDRKAGKMQRRESIPGNDPYAVGYREGWDNIDKKLKQNTRGIAL